MYVRVLMIGAFCSSCSLVVDAEREQCETTVDCTARGAAFARSECVEGLCQALAEPNCSSDDECASDERCVESYCEKKPEDPIWGCLDEEPPPTSTEPINVTIPLSSVPAGGTFPGLTGKVCQRIDTTCADPDQEVVSDEAGFHVTVPANFTGFLEITSEMFMPTLYFFPSGMMPESTLPNATMLAPGLVGALVNSLGGEADAERGHLLLNTYNCLGETTQGLTFDAPRADEKTLAFYVEDGLPAPDLTETKQGSGGFVNMVEGTNSVILSLASTDQELATTSLVIRAGHITIARFDP